MDITQLLSTAVTVVFLSFGVALMSVLAVVPTWLRVDAERHDAERPQVTERTPGPPDRHALAA